MKSYSVELVQRKTGSGALGKLATAALLGAGAYYGYKNFLKGKKSGEGEGLTTRILKAAKIIK